MKKKASVVILNWNGESLLKEFLPSVVQFTDKLLADIVIVDNASTDSSVSFVKSTYPDIKVIQFKENLGFAEGYNKALELIETSYSILLNSDVRVTKHWLEPLINILDDPANNNIVAVQPKILSERNKSHFEYAGAAGGFIDKYGYPFCRGRIFDSLEIDNKQYEKPIDIFWASGACLAIKTNIYFKVGGLDKTFFAHMEEIDLCWRLNASGYKLKCIPQSVIYHVGGATLAENSPRKVFLNFRNNLLMLYKNLEEKKFNSIFRIRKVLDRLSAIQMLLSGKKENAKAVLQAHQEFKKIKSNYSNTRDFNLKSTINKQIDTIYGKSILWQFYIRRKKTFFKLNWIFKSKK